ncbi:acyl carrier protein [Stella humosa]|uniref:Acyl carrier protein n=1 Tax=Stella humosa TaxID=94 RepID=A0A3N1KSF9_9PROT|nr:acyl carrier protein [Stella humosa]ROP81330.1 acyl carrier protein [Stella humosa]BBK32680.1 phosphopantetheine-binding protein [Stella humosa]
MNIDDRPTLRAADIQAWLATYLAEQMGVPPEMIGPDVPFETYGLDSVDAVVMASALETEFAIEVEPALFLRNPTVDAVYAELEEEGIARIERA